MRRAAAPLAALACLGAAAVPARAQQSVAVGIFRSEASCTVYAVQSGRDVGVAAQSEAAAVARDGGSTRAAAAGSTFVAVAHQWRTDLYRDCVDEFHDLRSSVEAALAASGRLRVVAPRGGTPVLTGRVSAVGAAMSGVRTEGVAADRLGAAVTVEYVMTGADGTVLTGGILTKEVSRAAAMETATAASTSGRDDQATYAAIRRDIALAVARAVTFRLDPLRVVEVAGRHVRVNHGAPLLALGTTVLVTPAGSMTPIKCIVSSASAGSAVLDVDGSGDLAAVPVGSLALAIEPGDPAANARRYDRVDLP